MRARLGSVALRSTCLLLRIHAPDGARRLGDGGLRNAYHATWQALGGVVVVAVLKSERSGLAAK